ncbi:TIGR01906 family membrane protein [Brassicibacter mesophilus]|uniref:TIGR01906 family membrane protein n=1 Tax=Brassicibacter mesophilus TaxID=745119 RepID=UPI003D216E33
MKKTLLFKILLVISLPLLLLLTNIEVATFDLSFFEKKYTEYNIMDETGIDKENLMKVTEGLLDYLKDKRQDIIMFTEVNGEVEQVFEEREILHMKDVKDLFDKGYRLRNIFLFTSIISMAYMVLFQRKQLGKTFLISAIWPLVLMIILAILMYIDFYKYFTYFHEIFFTNDLWLLNPKTDILIQMLPLEFFNSIAYKIVVFFTIELALILIIGTVLYKKSKHIQN